MARRGENIYHRRDGRWEGRYRPIGACKYKSVYAKSYTAVKELLRQAMVKDAEMAQQRKKRLESPPSSIRLLIEAWMAQKLFRVKSTTYEQYRKLARLYVLPYLGTLPPDQLTAQNLTQLIQQLCTPDGAHRPSGLSAGTLQCVFVFLKSVFRFAQNRYGIEVNFSELELPARHKPAVATFTQTEVETMKQAVLLDQTASNVGFLLAGPNGGLRLGEVCGLKWSDLDLECGILRVRRTVIRISTGDGHTQLIVQSPKSVSSAREIPLTTEILDLLRGLKRPTDPEAYFLTGTRTPMEPRTYQYRYRAFLKAAEIKYRNFHVLRHTFATLCAEKGTSGACLKELLGHSNVAITMSLYVHPSMDEKRALLESLCTIGV